MDDDALSERFREWVGECADKDVVGAIWRNVNGWSYQPARQNRTVPVPPARSAALHAKVDCKTAT